MPTMTKAGYVPPKQEPKTNLKKEPKQVPPKHHKPKKKKGKRKNALNTAGVVSLVIFAIAVLIGAGTIYLYTKTQAYTHTFLPGTMLMGYPLDGTTYEGGKALVEQIERERVSGWKMEITCMNQTHTITAQDIALSIDAQATLEPLWQAGRDGGMAARYIEMLRLHGEPMNAQPVLTYDLAVVDSLLELIRMDVECAPVDATVTFSPGSAAPFTFTDEETGYTLDLTGIREGIEQDVLNLASGSITLEPDALEPSVYRAELENEISLRTRMTAALDADAQSQHNAAIAAAMFNGVTVAPGETISFNTTVGRRTAEGGYVVAPEPAYGENISGVGGGVCQISTALYRAALLGGYDVIERSAAARPVGYCDMGQEATVSDQGLDLVIRNQTDAPLFIMARTYGEGKEAFVELTLFGKPLDGRYVLESLTEETGLIEEPVYLRDRDGVYATYSDERVPVGKAQMGYIAEVNRVTLDKAGAETAREIISEDTYEAIPPTIYVGIQGRDANK
ncbi:MAG: VanW family protein [Clostridia bacterium]|nr:VanW family protein [Clostridia bacterium]